MTERKVHTVVCQWGRIDIKAGRQEVLKAIKQGREVVAKIEIVLEDEYSDDGVSIEFCGQVVSCEITEK
jgi:hypothetical protein